MRSIFPTILAALAMLIDFGWAKQQDFADRKSPDAAAADATGVVADAQQPPGPAGVKVSGERIEVGFPTTAEKPETAWKVLWRTDKKYGLIVKEAWFYREEKWLKVLHDTRVAEIHVPYYNSQTRYFDIGDNSTSAMKVTDDMAKPGQNLEGKAVLEILGTGVQWMKNEGKGPTRMRRGEEMVLWAPLAADWYLYLVEFRFRDDGSISCRCGSSGFNSRKEPHVVHMHNTIWRLDVDLGVPDKTGNVRNSARWVTHKEPAAGKRDSQDGLFERPFQNGLEGGEVWKAEEFSRLRIVNNLEKNQQGNPISYDLVPDPHRQRPPFPVPGGVQPQGHLGDAVCRRDRRHPQGLDCRKLPEYVAQGRKIDDRDIVVWYLSSALHVPRDEDMLARNIPGVTLTVWSGFELRPRDLFSSSPFYSRRAKK